MATLFDMYNDNIDFMPEVASVGASWYDNNLKQLVSDYILQRHGLRRLVYPVDYIKVVNTTTIRANLYTLDKLYDTLGLVYNPIWNVDGTETLTYTRDNTGTFTDATTKSGSRQTVTSGTDTGSGTETLEKDGTISTATDSEGEVSVSDTISEQSSGTDTVTGTGSVTTILDKDSTDTTAKTAYNDTTFTNAERVTTVDDETSTENRNTTDTTTRSGTKSTTDSGSTITTEEGTNTQTFDTTDTKRTTTNNTTSGNETITDTGTDSLIHTDNLTEEYTEEKVRQGNIGVTSTQSLINQEREVAMFNFIDTIATILVNNICSGVW